MTSLQSNAIIESKQSPPFACLDDVSFSIKFSQQLSYCAENYLRIEAPAMHAVAARA